MASRARALSRVPSGLPATKAASARIPSASRISDTGGIVSRLGAGRSGTPASAPAQHETAGPSRPPTPGRRGSPRRSHSLEAQLSCKEAWAARNVVRTKSEELRAIPLVLRRASADAVEWTRV